jgi:exodeoxyribonuclease VII small subunit
MTAAADSSEHDGTAASAAGDSDDDGFEALYSKLEAVAARLDQGDLTLEQSVALYEEGMALAERCQTQLADIEQRIEHLRQRAAGGQ